MIIQMTSQIAIQMTFQMTVQVTVQMTIWMTFLNSWCKKTLDSLPHPNQGPIAIQLGEILSWLFAGTLANVSPTLRQWIIIWDSCLMPLHVCMYVLCRLEDVSCCFYFLFYSQQARSAYLLRRIDSYSNNRQRTFRPTKGRPDRLRDKCHMHQKMKMWTDNQWNRVNFMWLLCGILFGMTPEKQACILFRIPPPPVGGGK